MHFFPLETLPKYQYHPFRIIIPNCGELKKFLQVLRFWSIFREIMFCLFCDDATNWVYYNCGWVRRLVSRLSQTFAQLTTTESVLPGRFAAILMEEGKVEVYSLSFQGTKNSKKSKHFTYTSFSTLQHKMSGSKKVMWTMQIKISFSEMGK